MDLKTDFTLYSVVYEIKSTRKIIKVKHYPRSTKSWQALMKNPYDYTKYSLWVKHRMSRIEGQISRINFHT